jgi:3-methylfumaryl-CoA hydratase
MPLPDLEALRPWIGRSESASDVAAPGPAALLAATLDRTRAPQAGDPLPIVWHWLYFLPATASRDLGEDGMARRGGLMPPIALPRRMWAGSRIEMRDPIRLGDALRQQATVSDIRSKEGRTGPLIFVRVVSEIHTPRGLALIEHRDVVFSEPSPAAARASRPRRDAPTDAMWRDERSVGPVVLFRYSALTFNSHRIHYDEPYATEVEGFPGLVVPGPLLATMLAESLCEHVSTTAVRTVVFRAMSPIFADERFDIGGRKNGHTAGAWAARDGQLAMTAEAELG